jgi:hypothetical protein
MSESSSRSRHRLSLGGLLVGAVVGVVLTLAALLTWLWLHRDPTPPLSAEAIENARRLWQENRVANYDMNVEVTGQREESIRVQVRGGQVVAYTNNGRTPPRHTWPWWSVDGMFEQLEKETEVSAGEGASSQGGASSGALRAQFDPQYGYPQIFRRLAMGAGQGPANRDIRWEVTRFDNLDAAR